MDLGEVDNLLPPQTVTHLLTCKRRTIGMKLLPGERCQEVRTEVDSSPDVPL